VTSVCVVAAETIDDHLRADSLHVGESASTWSLVGVYRIGKPPGMAEICRNSEFR